MSDPVVDEDIVGTDPVLMDDGDTWMDPFDPVADYNDAEEGATDGVPVQSTYGSEKNEWGES